MRVTATAEFMLEPAFFPTDPNKDAGTSRDSIGLGQRAGKGLNTRHGTILTLEDISVSFDGFKALNDLNLYIGVGDRLNPRPDAVERCADRPGRHRSQVPEAYGVRSLERVRKP
jgi:hypothetical protein